MKTFLSSRPKAVLTSVFVLLCATLVYSQTWFPEGSSPLRTDYERLSLQKINYLLANGSSSSGPTLSGATVVTPVAGDSTIAVATQETLAQILTGSAASYMVRSVVIITDPGTSGRIGLKKGALSVVFRVLYAGNEWVIEAPSGCAFDANLIYAVALDADVDITAFALR